jgi:hypothetical protein
LSFYSGLAGKAEGGAVKMAKAKKITASDRINVTMRFTPGTYAALKLKADKQGRSISEEVEYRIDQTFMGLSAENGLTREDMRFLLEDLLEFVAEQRKAKA